MEKGSKARLLLSCALLSDLKSSMVVLAKRFEWSRGGEQASMGITLTL